MGTGGYQVENHATMQIKDRRSNRHEGAPANSWRKNRGKSDRKLAREPGQDASAGPETDRCLSHVVQSTPSYPGHERNYGPKTGVT